MSDSPIEILDMPDDIKDGPLRRVDSDDDIVTTKDKLSALEMSWEYTDASTEVALQKYKSYNLRFKDLATLKDKDLELLGITDPNVRARMLSSFSSLPGQEPTFEEMLKTTDIDKYNKNFTKNIANHLDDMKKAMEHAYNRIILNPPEDNHIVLCSNEYENLLENKIRGSELVNSTLRRMMDECDEMLVILQDFHKGLTVSDFKTEFKKPETKPKVVKKDENKLLKEILWIGIFAVAVYAGQKYLRFKLK